MPSWSSISLLPAPFLSLHLTLYLTLCLPCMHALTYKHVCTHCHHSLGKSFLPTVKLIVPKGHVPAGSPLWQLAAKDTNMERWSGLGCSPGQASSSDACTGAYTPWQPGPVAEKAGDRRAGTDIISCLAFSSRQAKGLCDPPAL